MTGRPRPHHITYRVSRALPFRLFAGRRTAAVIEKHLAQSSLNASEAALVRRVVACARLWPRECEDVVAELIAHFEDGHEAGVPARELAAMFGDVTATGSMIARAKRRQRPIAWKVSRRAGAALAGVAAVALAIYIGSAASLYLGRPAYAVSGELPDASVSAKRAKKYWALRPRRYEAYIDKAEQMLAGARAAVQVGNTHALAFHVRSVINMCAMLRAERQVATDLAAAQIENRAATEVILAIQGHHVSRSDPTLRHIGAMFTDVPRLDGARSAFSHLLDEMYAANGRLTAAGIDMMREMKQWRDPTLADRLMDPVWFAFPESRRSVETRFEEILGTVEHGRRRVPVARSLGSLRTTEACLRFPALSLVLPELTEVLVAHERAADTRERLVELVTLTTTRPTPLTQ